MPASTTVRRLYPAASGRGGTEDGISENHEKEEIYVKVAIER